MNLLHQFLKKKNSGRIILALFILTNVVYLFMLMVTIPNTMEYSKGMQLPDMMPAGYDYEYIRELFSTLNKNGRQYYLTRQIPVDMLYPALFAISYALIFAFFLKKIQKLNSSWVYLSYLPIIAGLADYLENIGNTILLNSYPVLNATLVKITNSFTIAKSMTSTIYFSALLILLVVLGIKFIAREKKSEKVVESSQKISS